MLNQEMAKELVEDHINKNFNKQDDKLIVLDEYTIERPYGWIFFYHSEMWLKTRDPQYVIFGNRPILVERDSGRLVSVDPAEIEEEVEKRIQMYEAKYGTWQHPKIRS